MSAKERKRIERLLVWFFVTLVKFLVTGFQFLVLLGFAYAAQRFIEQALASPYIAIQLGFGAYGLSWLFQAHSKTLAFRSRSNNLLDIWLTILDFLNRISGRK